MQMEMKGNRYYMSMHILSGPVDDVKDETEDFDLISVSDMLGKWTDIVLNFDTSGGREVLAVHVNGEPRGEIRDWIKFRPETYYFKYGMYRSFVSRHGGPMPTQILFIDEVKLGMTMESVMVSLDRPVD